MLKALLWKEWQEQRGRMALATVWLVGMTAIGLKTRILPDQTILLMIWIGTALVLPLFVGMGLFASERSSGTLAFLASQPAERGKILAAKVIVGLLTYMVPFLVCGTVACLIVSGREISLSVLVSTTIAIVAFGMVLLGWQLLAGLRCRREETYALVGLAVLAAWLLYTIVMAELDPAGHLGLWTWATAPTAIITLADWTDRPISQNWAVIVIQGLVLAGLSLGLWFRFCRLREGRS